MKNLKKSVSSGKSAVNQLGLKSCFLRSKMVVHPVCLGKEYNRKVEQITEMALFGCFTLFLKWNSSTVALSVTLAKCPPDIDDECSLKLFSAAPPVPCTSSLVPGEDIVIVVY